MTKKDEQPGYPAGTDSPPLRVRLPGFISDEEIGLGDAVTRTTSYLGIKTCAGCGRRAKALNRWLVFTNRSSK